MKPPGWTHCLLAPGWWGVLSLARPGCAASSLSLVPLVQGARGWLGSFHGELRNAALLCNVVPPGQRVSPHGVVGNVK